MDYKSHLLIRLVSIVLMFFIYSHCIKQVPKQKKLHYLWLGLIFGHISFLFFPFVKKFILINPLVHLLKIGFTSFPFVLWLASKDVIHENSKIGLLQWFYLFLINIFSISVYRYENQFYFLTGKIAPDSFAQLIFFLIMFIQIYLCIHTFKNIFRGSSLMVNDPSLFIVQYFLIYVSGGLIFTIIIILIHREENSTIRMWLISLFHLSYLSISLFYLILNEKSKVPNMKKEEIGINEEEKKNYQEKIKSLIETEKIYLQDNCSLKILSEKSDLPEYKIRRYILNELKYINFNHFLNSYRIKEAERILRSKENHELPIQRLALHLGYNSVKTFNRVFKEYKKMTPMQYKKEYATLPIPNS